MVLRAFRLLRGPPVVLFVEGMSLELETELRVQGLGFRV